MVERRADLCPVGYQRYANDLCARSSGRDPLQGYRGRAARRRCRVPSEGTGSGKGGAVRYPPLIGDLTKGWNHEITLAISESGGTDHETVAVETQLAVVVGGDRRGVPGGHPIRGVPGGSSQANDRWRIASGHIRPGHTHCQTLSQFSVPMLILLANSFRPPGSDDGMLRPVRDSSRFHVSLNCVLWRRSGFLYLGCLSGSR
jgi:hypothetical protein